MAGRDPIQEAVDMIAKGINRLIKLNSDPVPLLRQMASDIEGAKQDEYAEPKSAKIYRISDYQPKSSPPDEVS